MLKYPGNTGNSSNSSNLNNSNSGNTGNIRNTKIDVDDEVKPNYGSFNEDKKAKTKNNNNNAATDIFNKLKNRLPMFMINIYCLTTTLIYGENMLNGTIQDAEKRTFIKYYAVLCISTIVWDVWHSFLSYSENRSILNKFCFCLTNLMIALALFVVGTNIASFGLPFHIFFNSTKNDIIMFYGAMLPVLYIANMIENYYWKDSVKKYTELEGADDIDSDSDDDTYFDIPRNK